MFSDEAMTCAYENYRDNISHTVHNFIDAVDSMDMQNTAFSGFCKYDLFNIYVLCVTKCCHAT